MEGVKVSIDRIVVDFMNVQWTFFNPFREWLCHYYNAAFYVKDRGFKYHVQVREGRACLRKNGKKAYASTRMSA